MRGLESRTNQPLAQGAKSPIRKPRVDHQYILRNKHRGGTLYTHLRYQKKRGKRYGAHERRGQLPNKVSIDERPIIVERRERVGDWELDTIIGKGHNQAIVSPTERKSRLSLISKVWTKGAHEVEGAVLSLLKPLVEQVHTITSDNGKEFARHENIAQILNAGFYFAHPYASWERGAQREYQWSYPTVLSEGL